MKNEKKYNLIKCIITDVDGVLTDGGIYTGVDGISFKKFNVKDGAAVKILNDLGIYTVILSSESDPTNSKILESRSKKIGVDDCFYSIDDKKFFLNNFLNERNLKTENIAYIGDDINDLEAISIAGIKACPNDAVDEIKNIADIILSKNGGEGCFREFAEIIKSNLNVW